MNALGAFIVTAPIAFALGWFARDLHDKHLRGLTMDTATKTRITRLLDWLGHPRKLTVLVVVTAVAVLGSIAYTTISKNASDRRADDAKDDITACVQRYVRTLSAANLPRTAASVAASDARRDWDRGFSDSKDAKGLTKDELKDRYLTLYANYVKVRAGNPLPEFSRAFCDGAKK